MVNPFSNEYVRHKTIADYFETLQILRQNINSWYYQIVFNHRRLTERTCLVISII